MNETVTVTLSLPIYERVQLLAQTRQQSVEEVLDYVTAQHTNYIERRPGVQGGDPCIVGTRIPVWVLAAMHKQGDTAQDILEDYPNLTAAQVHAALCYYYDHRAEVDAAITTQNAAHTRIRDQHND